MTSASQTFNNLQVQPNITSSTHRYTLKSATVVVSLSPPAFQSPFISLLIFTYYMDSYLDFQILNKLKQKKIIKHTLLH